MTSIGSHRDRPRTQGIESWKVGAGMATLAGIAVNTPSMYRPPHVQRGLLTAIAGGVAFGIGVLADKAADGVAATTPLDGTQSLLAVAGTAGLGIIGTTLALRGRPDAMALHTARSAAKVVGGGAVVGALLVGEQALVDRIAPGMPGGEAGAHAALLGSAALTAVGWMHGRVRPTAVPAATEAAYQARLLEGMPDVANLHFDAAAHDALTVERRAMTTVSGHGPETLLPYERLNKGGKLFTTEATPAAQINRVMGTDDAIDPVRVWSGLGIGASVGERVDLAVREAERLGAFDGRRTHVMLVAPTGSGYVYPQTLAALETLSGGRSVAVGMQWSDQISALSYDSVPYAAELFEATTKAFAARIDQMPEGVLRPTLHGYGESLGGKAFQDVFAKTGPAGVERLGLDSFTSVGISRTSPYRVATIGETGHRLDASGTVFEFDNLRDIAATLTTEQRAAVRTWMVTHHNDPLSRVSLANFVREPEYLRTPDTALGIPDRMRHRTGVSGLQGIADMYNGANLKTGDFSGTGHSYKLDAGRFVPEIMRLPQTPETQRAVQSNNYLVELARKERTLDTAAGAAPWSWVPPKAA